MSAQPNTGRKNIIVNCGEICQSENCTSDEINLLNHDENGLMANIIVGYNRFIEYPYILSARILDLLQIASYIFCADRLSNRGERNSVDNESWARSFELFIPVSDITFWSREDVKSKLNYILTFMTGDRRYDFTFYKAAHNALDYENIQTSLFTEKYISIDEADATDIMLFSGGLDSLAGAIERLNEYPKRHLCLVSHKSNNSVIHTQNAIVEHLIKRYGGRIQQYGFSCHNKKVTPSREETQRTRMFLFTAIAFAICNYYKKEEFFIYENGITSLNLPKQADVFNARASRTTHPKTIGLLQEFYKMFDPNFRIITPYYNKTKAEIMDAFSDYNEKNIISSAVSCSSTRNKPLAEPHCGCCSQCIDRRFAVYAAGLQDYDAQYSDDIIYNIPNSETTQRVYNTLRLAAGETVKSANDLLEKYPTEVMSILEYWPGDNPEDKLYEVYDLFCRFGDSVMKACKAIQFYCENLSKPQNKDSLLGIIADRKYLETPMSIRVSEIDAILGRAIPLAFQGKQPSDENDFNDKVESILSSHGNFTREYPIIKFGISAYKADHAQDNLLIESKYIRGNTTPSVALKGINNDILQIPKDFGVLFVVYDPERSISNDSEYIDSFEKARSSCYVKIYR